MSGEHLRQELTRVSFRNRCDDLGTKFFWIDVSQAADSIKILVVLYDPDECVFRFARFVDVIVVEVVAVFPNLFDDPQPKHSAIATFCCVGFREPIGIRSRRMSPRFLRHYSNRTYLGCEVTTL